jgi:hypothetical protein
MNQLVFVVCLVVGAYILLRILQALTEILTYVSIAIVVLLLLFKLSTEPSGFFSNLNRMATAEDSSRVAVKHIDDNRTNDVQILDPLLLQGEWIERDLGIVYNFQTNGVFKAGSLDGTWFIRSENVLMLNLHGVRLNLLVVYISSERMIIQQPRGSRRRLLYFNRLKD